MLATYSPKIIYLYGLIWLFCCINTGLLAQSDAKKSSYPAPSEATLEQILQNLKNENQHQRLKIGGIIKGFFTSKEQLDYVFWLNEQEHADGTKIRQIVKLRWLDLEWKVACIGILPAGVHINKHNFVDVTGDEILEFLYSYSYSNDNCVDGCGILSLQGTSPKELYAKKEERPCRAVDWSLFQQDTELPFIDYQLKYKKKKKQLEEYRYVKKYKGGLSDEEAIEQAQIDSSQILLEYDWFSQTFIVPQIVPCNNQVFLQKNLSPTHPAVRMAINHLNKNLKPKFNIEGVYSATLSQVGQVDYLFYSNVFVSPRNQIKKRKLVKISCNGEAWEITGLLYVNANFSAHNIQDVDGNGLDEIIDETTLTEDNQCTKTYKILSFTGSVGKLIYTHKNNYASCLPYNNSDPTKEIEEESLGIEYTIEFKDIDEDGIKEIVQKSTNGTVIFKYDNNQQRFTPKRY